MQASLSVQTLRLPAVPARQINRFIVEFIALGGMLAVLGLWAIALG